MLPEIMQSEILPLLLNKPPPLAAALPEILQDEMVPCQL